MRFDVPFIPDGDYVRFLNDRKDSIDSVHFSLFQKDVFDARHKLKLVDVDQLVNHLKKIEGIPKYLLVNSRMHHPGGYLNRAALQSTLDKMALLLDSGVLNGLIYADAYFLQALSDTDGEVAGYLEAIPSINFMIDTYDKLGSVMDLQASTHFKMPGWVILDRSLNRRPDRLQRLVAKCRQTYPKLKLALLANEGCIDHCPFKLVHDGHIALANLGTHTDTHTINRSLGCMRYLRQNPEKLFKSPFIRPEDLGRYEDAVDVLKLCGRTLGRGFLERAVQAYIDRHYEGNLLDLLDALDWMAEELYIDNSQLPQDFGATLCDCSKDCRDCAYCYALLNQHAYRLGFSFKEIH